MADTIANMPLSTERGAPTYNPAQPSTLAQYFDDLDLLFRRNQVNTDVSKKKFACKYGPPDQGELWQTLEEYTTGTYDNFVKKIYELYPGATGGRKHSLADLDRIVERWTRARVTTTATYAEFYREFHSVAKWLISEKQLSVAEAVRKFLGVLPGQFASATRTRLQVCNPTNKADHIYSIADVHIAAQWVFENMEASHANYSSGYTAPPPAAPAVAYPSQPVAGPSQPSPPQPPGLVKLEDVQSYFDTWTKQLMAQLQNSGGQRPAGVRQDPNCYYCGGPHRVPDCDKVLEDVNNGEVIRRPTDRKICLPNGQELPRDYHKEMRYWRERVKAWHLEFPGNKLGERILANEGRPAAQMMLEVQPAPMAQFTNSLSADRRIEALERELFMLRRSSRLGNNEVFDGVEVPAPPPKKTPAIKKVGPPVGKAPSQPVAGPSQSVAGPSQSSHETHSSTNNGADDQAPSSTTTSTESAASTAPVNGKAPATAQNAPPTSQIPVHPYAKARDATYAPPYQRVVGAPFPAKPPAAGQQTGNPAYRTRPPAYDPTIASKVFERSLVSVAPLTVSHKELLSISPEICGKYRELVTPTRNPTAGSRPVASMVTEEVYGSAYLPAPKTVHWADDEAFPLPLDSDASTIQTVQELGVYDDAYDVLANVSIEPLQVEGRPNHFIIPDVYESYLSGLPPGEKPRPLLVAKESHALRCVRAVVDNKEEVDCILDGGSQIISMSQEVCHALGLAYDPNIQLQMQAANGTTDFSLGMCRNVPFAIGHIVVYLQVHVIRAAAYDILIGRPFDVLTKSVIRNFANEDQTITITCPNSGIASTVPTIPRGPPRFRFTRNPGPRDQEDAVEGFRSSRI